MTSKLTRANLNFFLRHPWQLVMAIIGISLGVAVVVSIDLARSSAEYAFERSTRAIVGRTTHRIVGGPDAIDETLYTQLRVHHGLRLVAPLVQGYIGVDGQKGRETLTLLGIDPFAEGPFRDQWYLGDSGQNGLSDVLNRLLSEKNSVLIDSGTANRIAVKAGEELSIRVGKYRQDIHILEVLANDEQSATAGFDNLVLADIATAQELLGMSGRLSYIDLRIDDEQDSGKILTNIEKILPQGVELVTAEARSQSLSQMTRAFHTNLTALSLLALLVGMFLVYNTMTFMVVQRRPLFAVLRIVGVTKQQLFRVIILEALSIGLIATILGIAIGMALGKSLLQLVNRTINDLYFLLPVTELTVSQDTLFKGLLLGLIATVAAAILPAMEATKVTPRQALSRADLETRTRRLIKQSALPGLFCIFCGGAVIYLSTASIVAGFIGIFAMILGCALLTPLITVIFMSCISPFLKTCFGTMGKLAARSIVSTLSRTAVAIGALMIAFATVVGIGLMIDSFRLSVDRWLTSILRADIYVSTPGSTSSGSHYKLDQSLANSIQSLPSVDGLSSVRRIRIESSRGLTELAAYELTESAWQGFHFKSKIEDNLRNVFEQQDSVIVSEPYAFHNAVKPGDTIQLRSDRGYRDFTIAAVYTDYGSDKGVVAMSRRTYLAHWQDTSYSGFGVYAKANTDIEQLRAAIQALVPEQSLWIEDRHKILDNSLKIFDRTFAITEVLRVLAAIIAFIGLFSALMALQLERTRELGTYRALGFLPSQLSVLLISETALLGTVAGLVAMPVGYIITLLLVNVINQRSFGWSMTLQNNPEILTQGFILALVSALFAGFYPAWKMSRTRAAEALRAE